MPKAVQDRLHRALSQRLIVLHRSGITGGGQYGEQETFKMAGTTGNVYTVRISAEPACDCPDSANGRNTCKHILYIMVKVLKAPRQLAFQAGLLPSELHHILHNAPAFAGSDSGTANTATTTTATTTTATTTTKRKPVGADDCPICFCAIEAGEGVVWCRAVCGTNLHASCFRQWRAAAAAKTNANNANANRVTCVMCRAPWIDADGNSDNTAVAAAVAGLGSITDVLGHAPAHVGEEGYVNMASYLGLSPTRDAGPYIPFWSWRRSTRFPRRWGH